MAQSREKLDVYLEIGKKRTFAGAIDWLGWCRSGKDEPSALQALFDYGPRYARVLRQARLGFEAPESVSTFHVIERLEGNATTDFGAPGLAPSSDTKPVNSDELKDFQKLLRACWRAFDSAVGAAAGKELRTGPRGGGRELEGIIRHVLESEAGYLAALGWKLNQREIKDLNKQLGQTREVILEAMAASARGEIAERGPRGGLRWKPRCFVRRVAWHVLDHAWEIEDRLSVDPQAHSTR